MPRSFLSSIHVDPFQVIRRQIPIRIKNVENPNGGGTVIHPDPDQVRDTSDPDAPSPATVVQTCSLLASEHLLQHKRLPTAVTIKERIVVLNVNSNKKSVSHGFLAGIFGTLDRFGVVVDLISTSEVHVSMAIEDNLSPKIMDRLIAELYKIGSVSAQFPAGGTTQPSDRSRCTTTWPSSPSSESRCASWWACRDGCFRPSPKAMSTLR